MSILLKAMGVLLTAAIFGTVLKEKNGEISLLITFCAVCTVAVYLLLSVWDSIEAVKSKLSLGGVNTEYFKIVLKALFIAYISETVADTCRDYGQSSMAHKAELAGKCVIFVLTVPLFCDVLETALTFLKL